MIFIVDLNQWFKLFDLNHANPGLHALYVKNDNEPDEVLAALALAYW